jgi:hypothetical protein
MLLACTAGGDHETQLIGWIREAAGRRLRGARAGLSRARSSRGRFRATDPRLPTMRAALAPARPSPDRCRAAGRRLRSVRAGLAPVRSSLGRHRPADLPDVVAGPARGASDTGGGSA